MKRQLFLILLCTSINVFSDNDDKDTFYTVSEHGSVPNTNNQQSSFIDTISSNIKVSQGMSQSEQKQARDQANTIDQAYRAKFGSNMGYNATENMMNKNNHDFVEQVLRTDYPLSDAQIRALWAEYDRRGLVKKKNKKDCEEKINIEIQRRQNERDVAERQRQDILQRVETERQACKKQQEEKQEQQNMQVAYEQYEKDFIAGQHQYVADMYDISFQAFGNDEISESRVIIRQQALEKTKTDDFAQYEQQYFLTPQTQAYLRMQDFDVSDYHNFFGTVLAQQFHQESCDIFAQAAILQKDLPFKSNILVSGILCADAAHEMNLQENITSVMSLTDLGFALVDLANQYGKAVFKVVFSSAQDFVHGIVHLDETIVSVVNALCFVIETVALNCYSEEYGFEDLYIPLRDQRNAQIVEGLKTLGSAIVHSTCPQKVEALTRFGADFFVPGKIMHAVGATLGVLRSQIKVARSVETVVALAGESLGVQEVACEVAKTAQKMEVVTQENIAQKTAKKLLDAEKQLDKSAKPVSAHGVERTIKGQPTPPRTSEQKKASALRKAERLKETKRELPDGRIRYYEAENFSDIPGPTRGRSFVVEHNPKTGLVRTWQECYDHTGKVNRVRPTMINGRDVVSQHYPATYKDIQNNIKGSKWHIPEKSLD